MNVWGLIRTLLFRPHDAGALGPRGESLAARRLAKQGYTILQRNLRLGFDEVDILALSPDGRTLVLVEVKTRSSEFSPPELAVDRRKQFRMVRSAAKLQRRYPNQAIRFDVVAIVWRDGQEPAVRHIEGAFASTV